MNARRNRIQLWRGRGRGRDGTGLGSQSHRSEMEGRLSTSTPITTSSGSSGIGSISSLQSSGIQSGKSSRGSPYRKESDQDTDPTGTAAPTEAGGDRSVPESEPYERNPDLPAPIPEPAFLVPYSRLWSFATPLDFGLVLVGTLAAAANGAALPFILYLLGRLVDALGSNQQDLEQAYREICQVKDFHSADCFVV